MGTKYQPIYKYTILSLRLSAIALIFFAIVGPLAGLNEPTSTIAQAREILLKEDTSVRQLCDWIEQSNIPDEGVIKNIQSSQSSESQITQISLLSYSIGECDELMLEIQSATQSDTSLEEITFDSVILYYENKEGRRIPDRGPGDETIQFEVLTTQQWIDTYSSSVTPFDYSLNGFDGFRMYIFSRNGLPNKLTDPGHSWITIAGVQGERIKSLNSYSSWPGLDTTRSNNYGSKFHFNVATNDSIHIDHPTDLLKSQLYFDGNLEDDVAVTFQSIDLEDLKQFVFLRKWFILEHASPNEYYEYQQGVFLYDDKRTNRINAAITLSQKSGSDTLVNSFWGIAKSFINDSDADEVAYDSIRSNCTAYSVNLWTKQNGQNLRYRWMLIIPAPSTLYESIQSLESESDND